MAMWMTAEAPAKDVVSTPKSTYCDGLDGLDIRPCPACVWEGPDPPKLLEICVQFVRANLHLMGEAGGLPDHVVSRLVAGQRADEVERLETLNPIWVELSLTDQWWQERYRRDFSKRKSDEDTMPDLNSEESDWRGKYKAADEKRRAHFAAFRDADRKKKKTTLMSSTLPMRLKEGRKGRIVLKPGFRGGIESQHSRLTTGGSRSNKRLTSMMRQAVTNLGKVDASLHEFKESFDIAVKAVLPTTPMSETKR